MDGFSVTALTSLCTSIASHAASGAAELQSLTPNSELNTLQPLRDSLASLGCVAPQLANALHSAAAISQNLQAILSNVLNTGDAALSKLHKQVMRLNLENANSLDNDYVSKHETLLRAYSEIFEFLTEILSLPNRSEQDEKLMSDGQDRLQSAEMSFNDSSRTPNILLHSNTSEKSAGAYSSSRPDPRLQRQNGDTDDDEPPPYVAHSSSSSYNAAPSSSEASGSSQASSFASFAKSFKAFTSHFVSRPDAFVSALCNAVLNGDGQQVSGLLGQGANVNGRNEQGKTPIQCAIAVDDEQIFHMLLAAGASPKGSGWTGRGLPPLFQAASGGKLRIAQSLVDGGADVMESSMMGQPYFYDVCGLENMEGIEFLLKNGAKAKTENIAGRPVLVQAVRSGNVALVALLLRYGASAKCSDATGTPAVMLAMEQKSTEMMTLLLDGGANPNSTGGFGGSMIADAIARSRLDVARLLLDHGAKGGASAAGQPIIVLILKDTKMTTSEKEEIIERLLKNGTDSNECDAMWSIPTLRCALESTTSTPKMIEMLLQHGAKVEEGEMTGGETPLLYAMDKGKREEVLLLLKYGADPNALDTKNRLPLMQAVVKGDLELVQLLRSRGAHVNEKGMVSVDSIARLINRPDMLAALGLAADQ